jgi:hypothetical protein
VTGRRPEPLAARPVPGALLALPTPCGPRLYRVTRSRPALVTCTPLTDAETQAVIAEQTASRAAAGVGRLCAEITAAARIADARGLRGLLARLRWRRR